MIDRIGSIAQLSGNRRRYLPGGPLQRDIRRREAWKLLSMTLMLPRDRAEWKLLRVSSDLEPVLYSSRWSVRPRRTLPADRTNPESLRCQYRPARRGAAGMATRSAGA